MNETESFRDFKEKIERVTDKTNELTKAYEQLNQELEECRHTMYTSTKEIKAADKWALR